MNLVKEYKGVKIYVSSKGEFYCDTLNNSNNINEKTFLSTKLQSIEKAIDDFKGNTIEDIEYYEITIHNATILQLRAISKVGSRLFFDDGTDTSNYSRRLLYPKSIKERDEFKRIESLFDNMKIISKEITELYVQQRTLISDANKILATLSKVSVV